MKQRLLSVLVLLVVVATLGFASNGDTINIGGLVPLRLELTVVVDGSEVNLDLTGGTVAFSPTIADITISTNSSAGWGLWVFAVNAVGTDTAMINADLDAIPYTISYSDGAANGVTGASIPVTTGVEIANRDDDVGSTGQLSITYTQNPDYPAGYYSDQLAIVLRAK